MLSTITRACIASAFVLASVIPAAPQSANRSSPQSFKFKPVGQLVEIPQVVADCKAHCASLATYTQSLVQRQARVRYCEKKMIER